MGTANDKPSDSGFPDLHRAEAGQGLSLDQLNAAFAEMLDAGDDPYEPGAEDDDGASTSADPLAAEVATLTAENEQPDDDPCEINPKSILEAMLFVGGRSGEPLSSERVAGFMRGVRTVEIDDLVRELNDFYTAANCPYTIRSEGAGYRLVLREEHSPVRRQFLGKVRQTQLSLAAIEVLAIVAYNEPITADKIGALRASPPGHLLTNLVGKQLLRMERVPGQRSANYHTTPKFLELFGLKSLADLPRGENGEF